MKREYLMRLTIKSGDKKGLLAYPHTPPYKGCSHFIIKIPYKKHFSSKIPTGLYLCKKFGETFKIHDVPNRGDLFFYEGKFYAKPPILFTSNKDILGYTRRETTNFLNYFADIFELRIHT